MENAKMLLFDLDGTLLDSRDFLVKESYETIEKYYLGRFTYESIIENFGGGFSRFLSKSNTSYDQLALDEFYSIKIAGYHKKTSLFPGVFEGLHEMKRKGYVLGIVTNQHKQMTVNVLRKHEIMDLFDVTVASEDVQEKKPSPEGIIKAMRDMGKDSNRVTMIGDSSYDIIAAQQAGVSSGLLSWYSDVDIASVCDPDFNCYRFEDVLKELEYIKGSTSA